MSVYVISWVLKHSEAKHAQRLVLLVLADHASSDGTDSYPSVRTIAREARLSETAVHTALTKLKAAGRIEAAGESEWKTTVYRVQMNEGVESAPPPDSAPVEGADPAQTPPADSVPKPSFKDKPPSEPSSLKAVLSEGADPASVWCTDCGGEIEDPRRGCPMCRVVPLDQVAGAPAR